ncbi:50S ribosomal protein L6 [Pararhizobium mangrovi]|uniref:Large ribosomal subunit protein uL6 n=1 Tax=Pararhizobium mangrovi TaxID=2590452 RepID=A0A506U7M2_9HYPH|nr:50S ribosomal protein L6 [Pararhizobium mangrovi]TPW29346.1 50S ribosomal protein L6 [Pararhizobium mangrovi]
MSRIGKRPVVLPDGVSASVDGQKVTVKGPKGEREFVANDEVIVKMEDNAIVVSPVDQSPDARAKWGMSRSVINNMVAGLKNGFERKLEINGVGYRAQMQGKDLRLSLGYSHDVIHPVPEDVTIACPKPTEIVISGADKQRVGQVAAKIRGYRSPEPYKGKGIKYAEERIIRKEGKRR